MIVRDIELTKWARDNVSPFDSTMINPASIDLKLDGRMKVAWWYWYNPITRAFAFKHNLPKWSDTIPFTKYVLRPGQFVLCSSVEITRIPLNCSAILFSKSSTGRKGIEHLHAGYGDPGFYGT